MTIDEAITRIEVFLKDVSEGAPEKLDDALRLGIEALKRVREQREVGGYVRRQYPLPGETEG